MKNNFLKKFDINKAWIGIFLLFFLTVPVFLTDNPVMLSIVFLGILGIAVYKFNIPKYSLFIFLVAFILRFVIILTIPTPAVSDFGVLLDASRGMINGDYSFLEKSYFQLWSYQISFVFVQSLLLRIWDNIIILKLFNCLLGSGTVLLVYLIAKEFVDDKASRMVSLIYCCLPFPLFYVTILSNQFWASFFIYLGIYLLIAKRIKFNEHIKYLLFAVLLVIANIMRPESSIPLLAVSLYLILTLNRSNFKKNIINIGILVGTYFVLSSLISKLFVITGVAPDGLSNNDPLWKFVLGFNHETGGSYSNDDLPYLNNSEAAIELIKSRIFVPVGQLAQLFKAKIITFWKVSSLGWVFNFCMNTGLTVFGVNLCISDDVPRLEAMTEWIMIFMYLLLIIGVVKYIKNKGYNNKIIILINQVFVTYGVYLLIEVQPRYSYHVQVTVLMLAALGVSSVHSFVKKRKCNDKVSSEESDSDGIE